MNPDSEQFEQLRKLLVLKRHEEPPPGYLNRFSGQVIARIRAGEQGEEKPAWLKKAWSLLETKPMLTGAFGAAVCALAISGLIYSEDADPNNSIHTATMGMNPALAGGGMDSLALGQGVNTSQFTSSTNPVSPSLRALFDQPQLTTIPAGFGYPGSN